MKQFCSARRFARKVALMLTVIVGLAISVRADLVPQAQTLLGIPDAATPSPSNQDHFLIQRRQYALSYNNSLRFPNWVAWHLNARDVGSTSRGQFQPDGSLPSGFVVVTPADYSRSGYDRGHNCPSADRSATRQDNDAVFLMSNMTPQAHGMNAGPWEQLESYCRDLAKQGNECYIICGHGFDAAAHPTIGKAQVAVPDFGWKIVVVVPDRPGNDLARITDQTRVIAVRMPNISTVSKQAWTRYIVTPAQIEQATGLHFFGNLPSGVAQSLRQKRDSGAVGSSFASTRGTGSLRGGHGSRNSSFGSGGSFSAPPANARGMVWVNTRSGAYWLPGSEYYGKTKEGKYMREKDALQAGYHPAIKKK